MAKDIIKGTCVDISSEGKGVIKNGRDIIFADGIFIGEEADIEILYQRAGVLYGKRITSGTENPSEKFGIFDTGY